MTPSTITSTNNEEVNTGNEEETWVMVSAAPGVSFALRSDGNLWAWGCGWSSICGLGGEHLPFIGFWEDFAIINDPHAPSIILENVATVSAVRGHAMAIKTDGSLWSWGRNEHGQLGNGTTANQMSPMQIMEDIVAISSGYSHSLAVKSDGSLWAWGRNESGQLGDGTTTNRPSPTKIMDNVIAVSAGTNHSAAITNDGALWTWGNNRHGQLGNGTTTDQYRPIRIIYDIAYVTLGPRHSMAIDTDGGLWVWGGAEPGWSSEILRVIMGDTDRLSPVRVMDDVAVVSTSLKHAMVIRTDGSLWSWGFNFNGSLGLGPEGPQSNPAPTKIIENVSYVVAGGGFVGQFPSSHTLAIMSDGSLWTWGDNVYSQIGDGEPGVARRSPVRILIDVGDDNNE
jgi:alpha-tubulin suppressor-like RCC1 family protein